MIMAGVTRFVFCYNVLYLNLGGNSRLYLRLEVGLITRYKREEDGLWACTLIVERVLYQSLVVLSAVGL